MTTLTAKVLADFTTSLASALAIGATTATLQSATDDDGVALPSGQYYFTLDGANSSKEHIRCTLSGTSLTSIYSISRQGVATSGTVRAHRLGATVTLTDFAHIKVINDLINGTTSLDSSNPLKYDGVADMIGDTNKLATVKYVNDTAIAGAPDSSTTTKGIVKMSTAPASATEPIAVGTNDTRVPTQDENDALAGTSGTPSSSNKYVTNDDTEGTGKIVRKSNIPTGFFGNGIDGDITISSNTTITRDMYYNNLTINTGVILTTGSFRIFVKEILTNNGSIVNNGNNGSNGSVGGTQQFGGGGGGGGGGGSSGGLVAVYAKTIILNNGSIISSLGGNGGAGGAGGNGSISVSGTAGVGGTGGAGGTAVSNGSLAGSTIGVTGANGGNGSTGSIAGGNGGNSNATGNITQSIGSASSSSVGSNGGSAGIASGGGGQASGGTGIAGGTRTNPYLMPYNPIFATSLFTVDPSSATPIFMKSSNGGNGGAGGGGGNANPNVSGAGGGGGAGGNGGSGGVIILVYSSLTNNGSISVAGGLGGNGGAAGSNAGGGTAPSNGSNGAPGNVGVIYQIII